MQHGLWRPDEPQVAGVRAEMAYTQDFVIAWLNGKPFLEKPPLRYALGVTLGRDRRPPLKKPMGSLRQHSWHYQCADNCVKIKSNFLRTNTCWGPLHSNEDIHYRGG